MEEFFGDFEIISEDFASCIKFLQETTRGCSTHSTALELDRGLVFCYLNLKLKLQLIGPNQTFLRRGSYVIRNNGQIIKTSLDFRYQLVGKQGELGGLVHGEDAIFLNLLIIYEE